MMEIYTRLIIFLPLPSEGRFMVRTLEKTFSEESTALWAKIYNISSYRGHQRAGWWWELSTRPLYSYRCHHRGRLMVRTLENTFSEESTALWAKTYNISSYRCHQSWWWEPFTKPLYSNRCHQRVGWWWEPSFYKIAIFLPLPLDSRPTVEFLSETFSEEHTVLWAKTYISSYSCQQRACWL